MAGFFGKGYLYPTPGDGTQQIGVCPGLGGDWIVGYRRPGSVSTRRIKSPLLPPMADPVQLQTNLDAWADKRRLREVI
jgi:hypothetical protein